MNPIAPVNNTQSIRFADFIRIQSRNPVPNDGSGVYIYLGVTYTILYVGTTDFTAYGAASNTVGLSFVSTLENYIAGTGLVTLPITYAMTSAPYPISAVIDGALIDFTGLGFLVKAGDATRDIKSTANETTFVLTGVDTAMLSLILGAQIKGSQIEAWHGFFDSNGQFITNLLFSTFNKTDGKWYGYCGDYSNIIIDTYNDIPNTARIIRDNNSSCGASYAFGLLYSDSPTIWYQDGDTITVSCYAYTQTTGRNVYMTFGVDDANVTTVLLTNTRTRYSQTFTINPTGTGKRGFQCTVSAAPSGQTNIVYVDSPQSQFGELTSYSANNGLYKFFTGYINSYGITEEWAEELRQYVATISVAASSTQIILRNRIAGRYTNDASWQFFNSGDESMKRVAYVSTINFPFGKQS